MSKPKDECDKPEKSSDKTRGAFKRSSIYRQEWEAAFQSYLQSLPQDRKTLPLNELEDYFCRIFHCLHFGLVVIFKGFRNYESQ